MILGDGKTPEQVAAIAREMASRVDRFLITRAGPSLFEAVKAEVDEAVYHSTARVISLNRRKRARLKDGIVLITGGTADMPVAEEAAVTCELMGQRPERIYDVGVAGLHRLLDHLGSLQKANVIIAIAGMEGALPGVVGGLVSAPVIAVPTSVGYGVGVQGLGALMTMLNTCSQGVSVVNIDNGFGSGYLASIINQGHK